MAETASEEPTPARPPAPYPWATVLGGTLGATLLLVLAVALASQFWRARLVDLRAVSQELGPSLETTLRNQGMSNLAITVHPRELREDKDAIYYFTQVEVDLPDTLNVDGLEKVIERSLWRDGIVIAGVERTPSGRVMHLTLGPAEIGTFVMRGAFDAPTTAKPSPIASSQRRQDGPAPSPDAGLSDAKPWTPPKQSLPAEIEEQEQMAQLPARVAIVIDDGGYGGEQAEIILGLDPRLTLSILPYTPYGTSLAERAAALGFEVMLHMPMENVTDSFRHEGQLNVGMPSAQIQDLTKVALSQIPFAVGVNNHMGSKYTASAEAMMPFLEAVKDQGLFFIDSGTTAKTIAYTAARELGIPCAARTLFLDNEDDQDAIRARIRELIALARQQGEAIGICHFRMNTALALRDMLPQFEEAGVQLVHASALVR